MISTAGYNFVQRGSKELSDAENLFCAVRHGQESMQAGADIQRKRMDEINNKIEEHMEQLMEASGKDNAPTKK